MDVLELPGNMWQHSCDINLAYIYMYIHIVPANCACVINSHYTKKDSMRGCFEHGEFMTLSLTIMNLR